MNCRVADFVGLAERLGDQSGVIAKARRRIGDVEFRFSQGLAVVPRFEFGEGVGFGVNQVGELEEIARALGGAHLRPRAGVEGTPGVGDGGFRVALGTIGHESDDLVIRGIEDFARGTVAGIHPRAIEKHRERFHGEGLSIGNVARSQPIASCPSIPVGLTAEAQRTQRYAEE